MNRVIIESGSQITFGGHTFGYLGQNSDGIWLSRADESGAKEVIGVKTLISMIRSEAASIVRPQHPLNTAIGNAAAVQSRLNAICEEQWRKTLVRWAFVQALNSLRPRPDFKMSDRSLREHASHILEAAETALLQETQLRAGDMVQGLHFPSTRSLRRWWVSWSRTNGSMISLINRRSLAPYVSQRHTPEQQRFLDRACELFLDPKELPKYSVISKARGEFNEENARRAENGSSLIPEISVRAYYHALNSLDSFVVDRCRKGPAVARARHAASVPTVPPQAMGERVEMDGVVMDVMTVLTHLGVAGRMTAPQLAKVPRIRVIVVMVIDVATRCILSFYVSETEDAAAAIRALHLATIDKTRWSETCQSRRPWSQAAHLGQVCTDAGSAFANADVLRAVTLAGGTPMTMPKGVAKLRGSIERVLRTINTGLLPNLSGRTFGNVADREGYNSEAMAVHTVDDLTRMLIRFITDVYHETEHSSLGGLSPRQMWDRLTDQIGMFPPMMPSMARMAFGYSQYRDANHEGVLFRGIPFNSAELQDRIRRRRDKNVQLFIDPFDLGAGTVLFGDDQVQVLPPDPGFRGVTLDEWEDARTSIWPVAQEAGEASVADALRAIEAIRSIDDANRKRRGLAFTGMTLEKANRRDELLYTGLRLSHRPQHDAPPSADALPGQVVQPKGNADISPLAEPRVRMH